jgi:hypothetical protein
MGQTLADELSPFTGRTKLKQQQQPTKDRIRRMHGLYHSHSIVSIGDAHPIRIE